MNAEDKDKKKEENEEKTEKKIEKRNLRQTTLENALRKKEGGRKVNFEMDKRQELEQLKAALCE